MKKFIIQIEGYALDGTIRYVADSDSVCCKLTADLEDAKMFKSLEAAQSFMSNYSVGDNAIVDYKEVTCLVLLNKEGNNE